MYLRILLCNHQRVCIAKLLKSLYPNAQSNNYRCSFLLYFYPLSWGKCVYKFCNDRRTFIWWKIRQSAALFWFGLRNVGILYSQAIIQRTFDVSPAFFEHGSAEKIAVWPHVNRDPNKKEVRLIFAWSGSELWILIKYSRSKI